MRHVYAEGEIVPGVGAGQITARLVSEFDIDGARVRELQPEGVVQVWFDSDQPELVKRLRAFSVHGFYFDHLDVT